jgi:multimeric flavodoxin WrbA
MRLLAIVGSPHKGNTFRLIQKIEKGIKKCGDDVEFDYLFLKDAQLETCKGCFTCVSKGEQYCPIKDDCYKIVEQMMNCDGIIFASPVYVFSVSALMKNFIDRLAYVCHRPCFLNKYAMVVTTSCGGGIPETLSYLERVIRSWGFILVINWGYHSIRPSPYLKKLKTKLRAHQNNSIMP